MPPPRPRATPRSITTLTHLIELQQMSIASFPHALERTSPFGVDRATFGVAKLAGQDVAEGGSQNQNQDPHVEGGCEQIERRHATPQKLRVRAVVMSRTTCRRIQASVRRNSAGASA